MTKPSIGFRIQSLVALLLSPLAALSALAAANPTLTPTATPAAVQALVGTRYTYYQITDAQSFAVKNSSSLKREIDIYLAAEAGSAWLKGNHPSSLLLTELPKALENFAQCGFGFGNVHLLVLTFNAAGLKKLADYASSSPYDPPFEFALFQDFPQLARPAVMLNKQGYAESFNADAVASLSQAYGDQVAKIHDLSFVPSDTDIGYDARLYAPSSYSLMAHEMSHVIGNLEHVQLSVPNIMDVEGDTLQQVGRMMSPAMNAGQCQAILGYKVSE